MQVSSQPNVNFNTLKDNIAFLITNVNSNHNIDNELNLSHDDANLKVVEKFSRDMKQQLSMYQQAEQTKIIQLMQNLIEALHTLASFRDNNSHEIIKEIFQKILPQECRADIINILQAKDYAPLNSAKREQEKNTEEVKGALAANGMQVQGLVGYTDWSGYFSGRPCIDIQRLSSSYQDDSEQVPTEDYFAEFITQPYKNENLIMLAMGLEQQEQQSQDVKQENVYDVLLQKAIEESTNKPVVLPCFIGNHYFAIGLYGNKYTIIDRSPHISGDSLRIIESKMAHRGLTLQHVDSATLLKQSDNSFINVEAGGSASTSSNACIRFQALNALLWKNGVETDDRKFILDEFPDFLDLVARNSLDIDNKNIFQEIQQLSEELLDKLLTAEENDKDATNTFRKGVIDIQLKAVNDFIVERMQFVTNEQVNTQSTTQNKNNIEIDELLRSNLEAAEKMRDQLLVLNNQIQMVPQNQSSLDDEPIIKEVANSSVNVIQINGYHSVDSEDMIRYNSALDSSSISKELENEEYQDDFEPESEDEKRAGNFKEIPGYIDSKKNNPDNVLEKVKIEKLEQEMNSQYTYENILKESETLSESINQGQNDQEQNQDQASVSRLNISNALPSCELLQLLTKQKILQDQYKKLFTDVKEGTEDYGVVIECRSHKDTSPDYIALTNEGKYHLVKSDCTFNNLNELNSYLTDNSLNPKELSLSSTSEDYKLLFTFMGKVEDVNQKFEKEVSNNLISNNLITKFLNELEQGYDESRISQPNNTSSQRDKNQARLQGAKSQLTRNSI